MTLAPAQACTPEELLLMEDGSHFELLDGELREREVSSQSSRVTVAATAFLFEVAESGNHRLSVRNSASASSRIQAEFGALTPRSCSTSAPPSMIFAT